MFSTTGIFQIVFFLFLQFDTVTPAQPSATLLTSRFDVVIMLEDNLVMKSGFELIAQDLVGPRAWRNHCLENTRPQRHPQEVHLAIAHLLLLCTSFSPISSKPYPRAGLGRKSASQLHRGF